MYYMYNLQPSNNLVSYKIVILGQSSVGKSSIVTRFIHDRFDEFQESTIGAAFFSKVIENEGKSVKFDIWDTAGQERYRSLAPMYYRGAKFALVVMDITQGDSLISAKYWIEELQRNSDNNSNVMLVGNKSDMESEREISIEDAEYFSKEYDISYIEVSAKTGSNIDNIFENIYKQLIEDIIEQEKHIKLDKEGTQTRKKCC